MIFAMQKKYLIFSGALIVIISIFALLVFTNFRQSLIDSFFFTDNPSVKSLSPSPAPDKNYQPDQIKIGSAIVTIELADSEEKRTKGLSGRESLPEDQGMLFVFSNPDRYSFWMKEMKIPLDIIWIINGKVIGYEENVSIPVEGVADASLPLYTPPEAVIAVLEVNAGFVKDNQIKIGDAVEFADLEPSI